MDRQVFLDYLERAVIEHFLTEQQAAQLLRRFDDGDLNEEDYPAPLNEVIQESSHDHMLSIWLTIASLAAMLGIARAGKRDEIQDQYQARMRGLAVQMTRGELRIADWSTRSAVTTQDYMLKMAMLGRRGPLDPQALDRVSQAVKEEQAYISRFMDDVAARRMRTDLAFDEAGLRTVADKITEILDKIERDRSKLNEIAPAELLSDAEKAFLLDERMSELQASARAALYGGSGRGLWFNEQEAGLDDGWIVDYIAVDDSGTCSPCHEAEIQGPYLPNQGPEVSEVCEGFGHCRCERVPRYDPEIARRLG
jgi:hypothetical protein